MAESEQLYRESCKRLHRIIANFFANKAWCAGADCVVVNRMVLNQLLELERVKDTRIEWINEDMQYWFPHVIAMVDNTGSLSSLYLSRKPIRGLLLGSMTDAQRIPELEKRKIICLPFYDADNIDWSESSLVTEMTLLAVGLTPTVSEED